MTSEGAWKKRQREINRDETRTRARFGSLTRQKSIMYNARAREKRVALARGELFAGALWVAGSTNGLLARARASIGPLCHCQYSKEVQIIW